MDFVCQEQLIIKLTALVYKSQFSYKMQGITASTMLELKLTARIFAMGLDFV